MAPTCVGAREERRIKESKKMPKRLSARGLGQVAEAQEAVVVAPVTPPVDEVEPEAASRVTAHARYLVVVAAEPKCDLLVEGN